MFERFGSPCVIAAASVIVLAATPAAAQGTPPAPPGGDAPPAAAPAPAPAAGASAGGSLSTGGLTLGGSADVPPPPPAGGSADGKPEEKWEAPTAGYNGAFYVKSKNDWFHLYFNGRLQFDFTAPFAAGAYQANLFPGFLVRRMRIENSGCFGDNFCYSMQPDFGPTSVTGTNQAAAPRTSSIMATAFVNYKAHDLLQVMMGIVQTPFGLEARTTSKYKDFLEDGISTKFAVPNATEQGVTLWGATDKNMFNYEVGVFGGDGAARTNADGRFDFIGRVFAIPMAGSKGPVENLQIGVSGKYGSRDTKKVNYDMHSITTGNGVALWSPTYAAGAAGTTRILPAGGQMAFGGELRVPVENFDLTGEFHYVSNKTREELDSRLGSGNFERYGELSGIAYYAQASYWFGKRDINGQPGYFRIAKMKFKKPEAPKAGDKPKGPDTAWRVRVRYDQVMAKYEGAKDNGAVTQRAVNGVQVPFYDGDIKIQSLQAGVDYFFTKHVGMRLNYGLYVTPDSAPATPEPGSIAPVATDKQRASVPGNRLAAGLNDDARRGAHSIHELILRAQVAF